MPGRVPSEQEVIGYVKSLSNWGRWGAEDELGTINLITPAKRAAAARLVQDGVAVTGARPIVTDVTADTTFQVMRFMVDSGEGRDTASAERLLARRGASEFIGMVFHGYTVTHIDTPAHFFWEGKLYNGRSCNLDHVARGRDGRGDRAAPRRRRQPGRSARRRAHAGRALARAGRGRHARGPRGGRAGGGRPRRAGGHPGGPHRLLRRGGSPRGR